MESPIQRNTYNQLLQRLSKGNQLIQVIAGPRQVGKTTMVKQLLENLPDGGMYVTADSIADNHSAWFESQWSLAVSKQAEAKGYLLVIDEVQKIPQWSDLVKRFWDTNEEKKTQLNLLLLGSSRLLLQQGLSESLMGRFELIYLGHWDFVEMNKAFGTSVEEYIYYGSYPGATHLVKEPERWQAFIQDAIIESSISRDILQLTRVDKPALLRNLFDLGCENSSKELSYTKILGQLANAGNTATLAHYLNLLGTAGLLSGLEKYENQIIRRRASSPKFQVHNNALLSSRKTIDIQKAVSNHTVWGRYVESAVGSFLINKSLEQRFSLQYWRDGNYEVDFVISKGEKVTGIEVKSGAKTRQSGLEKFKSKYPQAKRIIVGGNGIALYHFFTTNPEEWLY